MKKEIEFRTIDEYIVRFPEDTQKALKRLRATIKEAAPDAEETIKYAMPTFVLNGNLVYFAAFNIILAFTRPQRATKRLRINLLAIKLEKGQSNFRLINHYPWV